MKLVFSYGIAVTIVYFIYTRNNKSFQYNGLIKEVPYLTDMLFLCY